MGFAFLDKEWMFGQEMKEKIRALGLYFHLVRRWIRERKQMSPLQYAWVSFLVLRKAPCRLLIFGCGEDSQLWADLNIRGKTLFIEDDGIWAGMAEQRGLDVRKVRYQSLRGEWMPVPAVPEGFPENLLSEKWDLILVDAPLSFGESPGREQSIFTASLIRKRTGAAVFVHDYHRYWERACVDRYLGTADWRLSHLAFWY